MAVKPETLFQEAVSHIAKAVLGEKLASHDPGDEPMGVAEPAPSAPLPEAQKFVQSMSKNGKAPAKSFQGPKDSGAGKGDKGKKGKGSSKDTSGKTGFPKGKGSGKPKGGKGDKSGSRK